MSKNSSSSEDTKTGMIVGEEKNNRIFITKRDEFKKYLKENKFVIVKVSATWCGPCKLISKVVEKAAPEYKGNLKIVKIETDPNPVLVEKYEVYGLPTLMVFKDGQPVKGSKREGAINLAKLKDYLQSHGISPA